MISSGKSDKALEEKSQSYWAKGTGFGTGSTLSSWDAEQALIRQRSEEEHVTCLLQVSHMFNIGNSPVSSPVFYSESPVNLYDIHSSPVFYRHVICIIWVLARLQKVSHKYRIGNLPVWDILLIYLTHFDKLLFFCPPFQIKYLFDERFKYSDSVVGFSDYEFYFVPFHTALWMC